MKQGWEVKKISDVGKVYNGNSINEKVKKDKYLNLDSGLPYIATKDVTYDSVIDYNNGVKIPFEEKNKFKIAPSNTVLICAEGGSAGRKIGITNQEVCFGNKLFAFSSNKNVEGRFVYYYFFSSIFQMQFAGEMAGIIGGVSMNKFKEISISFPQLPEQQRIVAILDEAFDTIAKAQANAEQNLKNSKELFENYLQSVFENRGDGWEEKRLGDVCDELFAGGDVPKENSSKFETSIFNIPIFTNGEKNKGLYGFTNTARVIKPSITISARGTIGYSEIREEAFYPAIRLIVVTPKKGILDLYYLKYVISGIDFKHSGASIPQLTVPMIKEYPISFPSLKAQEDIVQKLNALSTETKQLEIIYQTKMEDLDELKKSILQKAFNGEL